MRLSVNAGRSIDRKRKTGLAVSGESGLGTSAVNAFRFRWRLKS